MSSVKALILDFAGVLCLWTPPAQSPLSPAQLRQIMSSEIWFEYECGRYSEEECYAKLVERLSISAADMASTMEQARQSLELNHAVLQLVSEIRKRNPGLKVYGMTNTPHAEQDCVNRIVDSYPVFDHVYLSGVVGMRKPDLGFYRFVLTEAGLRPDEVVFVDDKTENVLVAQSVGMHGVVFQNVTDLKQRIMNLMGDPVSRGLTYLRSNAKRLLTVTSNNSVIHENFAQLLILELTGDRDLIELEPWDRTWNYFIGVPQSPTSTFPNDLDTTSIALSVLPIHKDVAADVMDEILLLLDNDGIVPTYFDPTRPRVDPVVCVNVLSLFAQNGRESELLATFNWVLDVLRHRAYLQGTRYYISPDAFLYFLARLSVFLKSSPLRARLMPLLRERVYERVGAVDDAISLAMRVYACKLLGMSNMLDERALRDMQCEDGGFPTSWVYRFGSTGVKIGSRGLTTALAIKAIEMPVAPGDTLNFRSIIIFSCKAQ
ncbi:HAD family hydrolase [Aspergillus fijiensis CBS 313.89]|uniref:HAD-like protein n=1 Tax=Aspergillus fijiensis CBS 313.89 TaxID=1448319 RepID=A0A8G1S184_9EURO|nr:HAD-like protein [Aspergillus fijiensis CBS 313.89]RAK81491.1 HAD-like protein [Aspergillus fijiensis CBS 313.89]